MLIHYTQQVDKNREKFPHIKDAELSTRKRFVDETQRALNDVKSGMESPTVRRKLEDDENKSRRVGGSGMGSLGIEDSRGGAAEKDNSRFIANQRLVTQQNIEQQDIHLEALGNAADRLGVMSGAINTGL